MEETICEVCNQLNTGYNYVIRIQDDREKVEFNCHDTCADELEKKIKSIKNLDKKPVSQVLKELKINLRR